LCAVDTKVDTRAGQELIVSTLKLVDKIGLWRLTKILYYIDKKHDLQSFFWSHKWYSPTLCDITAALEDLVAQGIVGYKLCPKLSTLLLKPINTNEEVLDMIRDDVKRLRTLSSVELLERVASIDGRSVECWFCELESLYEEVRRGDRCALKELIGRITDRYSSAILELPFMSVNEIEEATWRSVQNDYSQEFLVEVLLILEGLDRSIREEELTEIVKLRKRFLDLLKLYLSLDQVEGYGNSLVV